MSGFARNPGTALAAHELVRQVPEISERNQKHWIVEAIAAVADRRGNTPTDCRTCSNHPSVFDAYVDGTLTNLVPRN